MKPSILLAIQEEQWQLLRVEGSDVQTRQIACDGKQAAAVKSALDEWKAAKAPLCLGLPSKQFLAASIDCGDLPRRDRQATMSYRLEEQLPLDIEALTVDFFPPHGGKALGAAVQTLAVKKLLDLLAQEGIEVRAICSTALLSLWSACQTAPPCQYALVAMDGAVDVLGLHDQQPVAWYTVSDNADEIVRCVEAHRLHNPQDAGGSGCLVVAPPEWQEKELPSQLELQFHRDNQSTPLVGAAQAASRLLAGSEAGWINVHKGDLAPTGVWGAAGPALRWAVILAMLLPVVISGAMLWRAIHYGRQADLAQQDQVNTYQKLYPNTPVPRLIRDRLQSDLHRFGGISGAGERMPQQTEALNILRQVVGALPATTRWVVLDLRIAPDSLYIEGQARSHSDAEAINRCLLDASLDMAPPRTESSEGGVVSFTFSGSPRPVARNATATAPGSRPAAPGGGTTRGAP